MIIDIHAHAFPDDLAPRAIGTLTHNCDCLAFTDGTCSGLAKAIREAGVDLAVIMPIATKPTQTRVINSWAVEVRETYPELISFGSLHPFAPAQWAAEIEQMKADGIRGIKLHPDYQAFFVDDPEVIPMYHLLADAGLVVLFHAGVDIGLPPPTHATPDRLAHVLDEVPDLTAIAAHMGGYLMWDDVEKHLIGRDLYLDTSYSLADMGPERMAAMIKAHGAEKILFGTDSPWTPHSAELDGIRALALSSEEIDAVLGNNAAKLLGLEDLS